MTPTVVFLPWQVAANGQLFAEQMKEQGKGAKVFGSDGLDSGDFTSSGAYVSSFARDIHGLPGTAKVIAGYNKKYGTKWSTLARRRTRRRRLPRRRTRPRARTARRRVPS